MFDDFDLFETCEEYYDDATEFERMYAEDFDYFLTPEDEAELLDVFFGE